MGRELREKDTRRNYYTCTQVYNYYREKRDNTHANKKDAHGPNLDGYLRLFRAGQCHDEGCAERAHTSSETKFLGIG